jgi:hypothetical protein
MCSMRMLLQRRELIELDVSLYVCMFVGQCGCMYVQCEDAAVAERA